MKMEISPQEFEKALYEILKEQFPEPFYTVIFNHKIRGKYSKRLRQLDVAVYHQLEKPKLVLIGEAKRHNRPIDIKNVETFIGMFNDLEAESGILAPIYYDENCKGRGFTKSAKSRIEGDTNLKISILPILAEDALILNWKETARKIFPYDWSFHNILSKSLYHLARNEINDAINDIEGIMYEEWQALVNYGLKTQRENTVKFLKAIMKFHIDIGWRFQAVSNLFYNNLLSEEDIKLVIDKESDSDFDELLLVKNIKEK